MEDQLIILNQFLNDYKNHIIYSKINNNCESDGCTLVEIQTNLIPLYLLANYKNGVLSGNGVFFTKEENGLFYLVKFENNSIVHLYNYVIKDFDIIDEEDGKRWEGAVCIKLDNQEVLFPCGYGVYYDEDGNVDFRGIRFGNELNGYGTMYWNKNMKCTSFFIHGKEFGFGIYYDRKGNLVEKGIAVNGIVYLHWDDHQESYIQVNSCSSTSLYFDFTGNQMSFPSCMHFSLFHFIQRIEIANDCKTISSHITIQNLPHLQFIQFPSNCFVDDYHGLNPYDYEFYCLAIEKEKSLIISDCPCLTTILFNPFACSDFINIDFMSKNYQESLMYRSPSITDY